MASLEVQPAGFHPGSRSLLVALGFSPPPDESSKVGRTRQICNKGERERNNHGEVKDRNNNAYLGGILCGVFF